MTSSKMFLNDCHTGDEWSSTGWPHVRVVSGYSLETTYCVVPSSPAAAVLFVCHGFLLTPLLEFSFPVSAFKALLSPWSLCLGFWRPCWERCGSFTPSSLSCVIWAQHRILGSSSNAAEYKGDVRKGPEEKKSLNAQAVLCNF